MPDAERKLPPDARNPTTKARQGITLGVMRWVLLASLIGVVGAFIIAYVVISPS